MPDVTSTEEKDWGPEQSECPEVGSIFLLRLDGSYSKSVATDSCKYKLANRHGNDLDLELWTGIGSSGWLPGHQWKLSRNPTFRLLLGSVPFPGVTAQPVHPNGCVCTKCHARNFFAEPNRADGTYLCRSCRPSWER